MSFHTLLDLIFLRLQTLESVFRRMFITELLKPLLQMNINIEIMKNV